MFVRRPFPPQRPSAKINFSFLFSFVNFLQTYPFFSFISVRMDDWSFTIQVSSKLVATVRSFMSTQQRVVVRAKCSLPEFKHKVRSKFGIPSQVDLQFFWDEVELTLANFKTILPQVRFKSRSPKLVLSFDTRK